MFLSFYLLIKQHDECSVVIFLFYLFKPQGTQHCSTERIADIEDLKANTEELTMLLSELYNTALLSYKKSKENL